MTDEPLLFRFHRGSLADSMETVTTIESFDHLKDIIAKNLSEWFVFPKKITIKPYVYDERIKWDTHIVILKFDDSTYPVGFMNRNPDWNLPTSE